MFSLFYCSLFAVSGEDSTGTQSIDPETETVGIDLSYTGQIYYTCHGMPNRWLMRFIAVKDIDALQMVLFMIITLYIHVHVFKFKFMFWPINFIVY